MKKLLLLLLLLSPLYSAADENEALRWQFIILRYTTALEQYYGDYRSELVAKEAVQQTLIAYQEKFGLLKRVSAHPEDMKKLVMVMQVCVHLLNKFFIQYPELLTRASKQQDPAISILYKELECEQTIPFDQFNFLSFIKASPEQERRALLDKMYDFMKAELDQVLK